MTVLLQDLTPDAEDWDWSLAEDHKAVATLKTRLKITKELSEELIEKSQPIPKDILLQHKV